MKLKDVMKTIEKLNELRDVLKLEKAYIEVYIDSVQIGREFHTLNEVVLKVKEEYIPDFWRELLNADFKKTYNNTLSVELIFPQMNGKTFMQRVDLFIDC